MKTLYSTLCPITREISIQQILNYFLIYGIINLAEAEIARKTGVFPKDTLQRLKMAEQKINQISKN